jgi:zinc transporter 1/2/3
MGRFCVDSDGEDVRVAAVTAGSITPTPTVAEGQTTAVTACHSHETEIYCINGAGSEVLVEATMTEPLPAAYTGCHAHGADLYCLDPAGEEVMVRAEGATSPEAAGAEDGEENQHCHFHAGVE